MKEQRIYVIEYSYGHYEERDDNWYLDWGMPIKESFFDEKEFNDRLEVLKAYPHGAQNTYYDEFRIDNIFVGILEPVRKEECGEY